MFVFCTGRFLCELATAIIFWDAVETCTAYFTRYMKWCEKLEVNVIVIVRTKVVYLNI